MKRIYASLIGIDQGTEMLFSDFDTGGEMWAGTGPRDCRVPIKFSEKFKGAPTVMVALEMFDMSSQSNQRVEIVSDNITKAGFDIVFRTWGDTKIARAKACWTAFGGVAAEDEWDVY